MATPGDDKEAAPRSTWRQAAARWAAAGMLVGCAVGVVDALTDPTVGALRLGDVFRHACLRGTLYASLAAPLAAMVALVLRVWSRLSRPRLVPSRVMAWLIAGPVMTAATMLLAYRALIPTLANRKHAGLVVAIAMLSGALALTLAAGLASALVPALEQRVTRRATWLRVAALAAVLIGIAGTLLAWRWRAELVGLPVRLGVVTIVICVTTAALALTLQSRWQPRWRWLVVTWLLVTVVALRVGRFATVAGAATRGVSLARALVLAARQLWDRDHDGYSPLFGGGDCNDRNRRVHPGAREVANDGIDQNCFAGDTQGYQAPASPTPFTPAPPVRNILLITIDTLRADHLGAYGYRRNTSPNLDALAASGGLFVNAWAHAPSTRYSMPAILTGRLPLDVDYDHSAQGWPGLAANATTFAEIAAAKGLVTGAITNHWYFDKSRRMNQGFSSYDNDNARLVRQVGSAGPAETSGSSSKEQTDKAIAFANRHASAPWLLWVHYYDPHYLYETHAGIDSFGTSAIDRYDGEIRFTDLHIGRLFDALRANGQFDQTAIVVTGDHGEGFGEHGVDLHGYHLYAAQTKVPLLVKVPGVSPARVQTPVGHVDLVPTIANLVGGEATPEMQGRSLVPWLMGTEPEEINRPVWQQLSFENRNEQRGLATARCHVIYYLSPTPQWSAFRIDQDPTEAHDVAASDCATEQAQLAEWIDAGFAPRTTITRSATPPNGPQLDVVFDGATELVRASLPVTASRGTTISASWTWRRIGEVPPSWRIFVHFERDASGRFIGDHEPPTPIEAWPANLYASYTSEVAIPADVPLGSYAIWAGLWRGDERWPATTSLPVADRRIRLGTIEITEGTPR